MKIIETILNQLTNTDTLLESMYQLIAETDSNYAKEIATYRQGVQELIRNVPNAETYLEAKRQELASNIRFAMWQGFQWNLDCFRNPVNKLLVNMDFDELCQEDRMQALPKAQAAQRIIDSFVQTLPADKRAFLNPIIDHYAYLETYGYRLAHHAGFALAEKVLPLVVPGYISDPMLTMQYVHTI